MKTNRESKHSSGRFGVISMLLAIALFIALPVMVIVKPVRAEAKELMVMPTEVLAEVNRVRNSYGLSSLQDSDALANCAKVRAAESAVSFSHVRPDGSQWFTVNPAIQYGENLLWTSYNRNAQQIVELWMNSPTHRELILDGGFRTAGVGNFNGSDGIHYWTLEFGY